MVRRVLRAWTVALLVIACRQLPAPEPAAPVQTPETLSQLPSSDADAEAGAEELWDGVADATAGTGEDKPARALGKSACNAARTRTEAALKRAARCDVHGDCARLSFHYAFAPCGIALRKDASLDVLRDEASRYGAQCRPVMRPVRCAYKTGALCRHQRCTLASSEEQQAQRFERTSAQCTSPCLRDRP